MVDSRYSDICEICANFFIAGQGYESELDKTGLFCSNECAIEHDEIFKEEYEGQKQ